MSQLTIQLSDKADALIVQLQKEIFNRRRKKVPAEGVIETMLESAAKSQSDQRFATSWQNLIADIEKAASIAAAHGAKPANLSDEEWALVLSHRSRAAVAPSRRPASAKTSQARRGPTTKPPAVAKEGATGRRVRSKPAVPSDRAVEEEGTEKVAAKAKPKSKPRVAKAVGAGEDKASVVKVTARARTTTATLKTSAPAKPTAKARGAAPAKRAAPAKGAAPEKPKPRGSSSVARRMAKAVSRLGATAAESGGSPAATSSAPSMSKDGDHAQGSSGSGGLSS
jgi:hypothetical protein